MALFKRRDKKNDEREQLGKPIIKDTEVNKVSDVSRVQVVDTSQKVSDVIPSGDITKTITKKTSSGSKANQITSVKENVITQQ